MGVTGLLQKNKWFRSKVEERYEEGCMYWVSEQIDTLRPALKDWSFGLYNRNHWQVNDNMQAIENAVDSYTATYGTPKHCQKYINIGQYRQALEVILEAIDSECKTCECPTDADLLEEVNHILENEELNVNWENYTVTETIERK